MNISYITIITITIITIIIIIIIIKTTTIIMYYYYYYYYYYYPFDLSDADRVAPDTPFTGFLQTGVFGIVEMSLALVQQPLCSLASKAVKTARGICFCLESLALVQQLIHLSLSIYIYIQIDREREIPIFIDIYIYIYIYIYV